jgi:serine/threonine protein kinase
VLGRTVAVKTFRFDAESCEMLRIETEMRTLAGLQHPGLVTLYDAGVADRMPYSSWSSFRGQRSRSGWRKGRCRRRIPRQ